MDTKMRINEYAENVTEISQMTTIAKMILCVCVYVFLRPVIFMTKSCLFACFF